MKRPEHLARTALAVGLVAAGFTGCTHSAVDGDSLSPSPLAEPTSPPLAPTPPDANDTAASSTPPAQSSGVKAPTPGTVTVSGGALPGEIVDSYRTNGGDLVDPVEWTGRYGTSALPSLVGDGVALVEATRRFEGVDGGWERIDEANWLTMADTGRDSLLAELAVAAGITDTATRTSSSQDGADCAIDTYPTTQASVGWVVQGCSYERFPQLVALGVSRTAASSQPPTVLDATMTSFIDTLDGTISFAEVRLGSPGPDGATLHLSAQVHFDGNLTTVDDAVSSGVLADWQRFVGEDSLLLSGPTGATWTLSDGVGVFEWAGRW